MSNVKAYGAFLDDDNDILKSSSGGVATAFARKVIESEGVVFGVAYSEDCMEAEYIKVTKSVDIEKLRGSKVIDIRLNGCFEKVQEALKDDKIVLFFGLPCVNAALLKYLKKDYDNLIRCELICSGRVPKQVHIDYCNYLKKKYKSEITSFTVRGKKDGWLPEYLIAHFSNGATFTAPFKRTEYGQAFKILKEKQCLNCMFKGENRTGDIMIGDYWGIDEKNSNYNKNGVSAVLIESTKGLDFFYSVSGINRFETTFEDVIKNNPSIVTSVSEHTERNIIEFTFNKKGLFPAMKKSKTMRHIRRVDLVKKIPVINMLIEELRK